jgi:hypothetical protein
MGISALSGGSDSWVGVPGLGGVHGHGWGNGMCTSTKDSAEGDGEGDVDCAPWGHGDGRTEAGRGAEDGSGLASRWDDSAGDWRCTGKGVDMCIQGDVWKNLPIETMF